MASEDYKESEMSKIVKRLMDEEGFEFGEAVKEAMEQTKKFESKADGGSIGIEVLFTDKMANGGRAGYVSGGAALKLLEKGKEGIESLYNVGKSIFSKGDDAVDLAKQEEIFRSGNITTDFLENVDDKVIKKFVTTRDAKGPGGYGLYDSFDDMPNGLKAAELISRIKNADGGIDYEAAELFIGKKLKGNETVNELISMVVTEKKADGGRVGLFMGGPALEGPSLSIYDSMKAYGATDQAISDAIKRAGYELPTADSGTTPETTPSVSDNLGITDPQPYSKVDQLSYRDLTVGDGSNFGPGKKLEINPAALGMSFYDAEPAKKEREGFIGKTIDAFTSTPPRQLSQFTTPTGVSNLRGPAELGFMTTDIEGLPGLNRDMIRSQYDNYSQFFGRPSNFPDAKVPGKASQLANMIPYVGTAKKGLEAMFGPAGPKSLQSKYTVDGAGFGNTGARDEFGLATFDRKDGFLGLTGDTTRDYTDRMSQRLDELGNFFSSKGIDINDPDAYNKMKDINSTYAKQVLAYQQRTAVENLNKKQKDAVERQKQKAIEEAAKKQREAAATIAAAEKAARERELARRQTIVDAQKATTGFTTSGGAGNYRSDRDNSRDGGYGGSSQRSRDNRSSDLGFSDIRLKENVELIGKSPSNINIYKFNYKDSPTTYQGAMAHEVPWASVKHSNGYMMIDYNKIDVEFKLYDVH